MGEHTLDVLNEQSTKKYIRAREPSFKAVLNFKTFFK